VNKKYEISFGIIYFARDLIYGVHPFLCMSRNDSISVNEADAVSYPSWTSYDFQSIHFRWKFF